jgi:REP element-mobilizing transposase RayT
LPAIIKPNGGQVKNLAAFQNMNMKLHRNSFKRFYSSELIYFTVSKTQNNYPYFKEKIFCDLLIEEIKIFKKLRSFLLFAFSIMYDHLNFIIKPATNDNISNIMRDIKKNFSRDYNLTICPVGEIPESRLQGKQYIRRNNTRITVPNLTDYRAKLFNKYGRDYQSIIKRFKWQQSFYDHYIRNWSEYKRICNYTVFNDVKHGLPDNWPYTSENYPELIDPIE